MFKGRVLTGFLFSCATPDKNGIQLLKKRLLLNIKNGLPKNYIYMLIFWHQVIFSLYILKNSSKIKKYLNFVFVEKAYMYNKKSYNCERKTFEKKTLLKINIFLKKRLLNNFKTPTVSFLTKKLLTKSDNIFVQH